MTCGTVNYVVFLLLLLKVLPLRPGPAAMGAFLFAFGSSRINYLANPQLLPHFFSIIAILALLRIFDSRGPPVAKNGRAVIRSARRRGPALFILLHGMVFRVRDGGGVLLGLVGSPPAAEAGGCPPPRRHPDRARPGRRRGPHLAAPHALSRSRRHGRLLQLGRGGLGMPLFRSWIYMGPDSWLYGWMPGLHWFLVFGSLEPEQRLGVGLAALVVCLIGLMRGWENPIIRVFGLTGLTLFLVVSPIPRGVILGLALMEWVLWPTVLLQAGGKRETRFIAMLLFALLCWVLFPGFSLFKMCVCWAPVLAAGETVLRRQRMFLYATAAMVCTLFLIGTTFLNMYDVLVTAFVGI